MELQCVPGRFESAEGQVQVFEPLLFEECRAQLCSSWEELCDAVSRDAYSMVHAKNVDRQERGIDTFLNLFAMIFHCLYI